MAMALGAWLAAAVALAVAVACVAAAPEQIHTAFAQGATGLSFMWYTSSATSTSTVNYGLDQSLGQSATGTTQTYDVGFHHVVVVAGLKPNTRYYYSVGDATDGFSTVYSVVTARAAGDPSSFVVGIIGDMGITNSQPTTDGLIAHLETTDFVWHIGDLGYSDDRLESSYESTWNTYMNQVQPIAATHAYMVMPGNHETTCTEVLPFTCAEQHRNFTAYRTRFHMPYAESGAVNNMWYSFDYGPVHFISISTETDFSGAPEGPGTYLNAGPFGDQVTWLKNDLQKAAANRQQVPWIIVGGHRPVYSVEGFLSSLNLLLEPLFLQYGVDFYFCGHVHLYERLWPVLKGTTAQKDYNNPKSPVYIINGAAGNIEGHSTAGSPLDYLAFSNAQDYGYGYLTVINSTAAKWDWYSATDQTLKDSITVIKDTHGPY